jgi:hypothetical protein
MNTKTIQVPPAEGTTPDRAPRDIAAQFCQRVITPQALAIANEHRGPTALLAVTEFYTVLIAHLALDVRLALGTDLASKILAESLAQLQRMPHESAPWGGAAGSKPH